MSHRSTLAPMPSYQIQLATRIDEREIVLSVAAEVASLVVSEWTRLE